VVEVQHQENMVVVAEQVVIELLLVVVQYQI